MYARSLHIIPKWQVPELPSVLRQRIIELVNTMQVVGGSPINSLRGLFITCFQEAGRPHAFRCGMVLSRLFEWYIIMQKKRKSTPERYVLYRTQAEWEGDFCFSYDVMRRVREHLHPIVVSDTPRQAPSGKSGWKAPQTHYRLDVMALTERIAEAYGKSLSFVRGILLDTPAPLENQKGSFLDSGLEKRTLDSGLEKPLTTRQSQPSFDKSKDNTQKQTPQTDARGRDGGGVSSLESEDAKKESEPFVQLPARRDDRAPDSESPQVTLLVSNGVYRSKADKYAWVPLGFVQEIVAQVNELAANGKLKSNRGGYLFNALRNFHEQMQDGLRRHLAHHPSEVLSLAEYAARTYTQQHTQTPRKSEYDGLAWSDLATSQEARTEYYTGGRWGDIIKS